MSHSSSSTTLLFVHGFMDGAASWEPTISSLGGRGGDVVCVDLAGMGARAREGEPFTLDRFTRDVSQRLRELEGPVVLIGQSMGAQVAELVAGVNADRVAGIVLLTPVPLAGTKLPAEAMKSFHALGGDPAAQRALRQQLSVSLCGRDLEMLGRLGDAIEPAVVGQLAEIWNEGHPLGRQPSLYRGPVLVVQGEGDPFVTEELLETGVLPRFAAPQRALVANAGHWPHVEQPASFAKVLLDFVATLPLSAGAAATSNSGWTGAFAKKSATAFADAFAEDVALEASVLTRAAEGVEAVKTIMGTASGIYESLAFTRESSLGNRSYLEWEATAFGGKKLLGITILTKRDDGKIARIAIHHRPLGAVLRFSSELRQRLQGKLDADLFYPGA